MCPVWLRNAAVLGDRGALCGPYVTTGCLEAAHIADPSNGTLTTRTMGDEKISDPESSVDFSANSSLRNTQYTSVDCSFIV